MKRVTTVDLIRNFGLYSDAALSEPIFVTKNGRDRLVLISIEQFNTFQHALDALEDAKSSREGAKPQRRKEPSRSVR
jgi:PHD/YefM family antitoxin component YafN of YafNO toxin-antitoxin module